MLRKGLFSSPVRRFVTQASGVPASLTVTTWLPARKIKERNTIVSIEPMSSIEAKRALIERSSRASSDRNPNETIDIYGHAAAELIVDFTQTAPSSEITVALSEHGINMSHVKSLHAYLSWFPRLDLETGRSMDVNKRSQFLSNFQEQDDELQAVKKRALEFLATEYQAVNNTQKNDVRQYGIPDPSRVFILSDIDVAAVIRTCFRMMQYTVTSSGVLTMTVALPDATYYGLDMLIQHREMTGNNQEWREPISAEHVCTTVVLRLIEAGIGKEKFRLIVKKVLEENPELSHGFPIVELTHAIVKQVALEAAPKNASAPKIM